jgi:hypothetical protein
MVAPVCLLRINLGAFHWGKVNATLYLALREKPHPPSDPIS